MNNLWHLPRVAPSASRPWGFLPSQMRTQGQLLGFRKRSKRCGDNVNTGHGGCPLSAVTDVILSSEGLRFHYEPRRWWATLTATGQWCGPKGPIGYLQKASGTGRLVWAWQEASLKREDDGVKTHGAAIHEATSICHRVGGGCRS